MAAGGSTAGGATRFAVEDLLAAGAVVDALASRGIDYASPEAAAACAAFTGLRPSGTTVAGSKSCRAICFSQRSKVRKMVDWRMRCKRPAGRDIIPAS